MKRILSLLLALVLTFSFVPIGAQAASSYNAAKALDYGKNHWNDGVGLCAEFVSNCLKAGGLKSWNRECTNLYNQLNKEVVGGAKIATVQYLKTSGNYIKVSDNKGKVSKGDVLFWLCSGCPTDSVGGPYQHTALISDVSGTYVKVYQHNGAVNNQPAWVGNCYECGRAYSHMVVVHFGSSAGSDDTTPKVTQYFDCDVKITTTKGKAVNGYANIGDSKRLDYFDQGQTLYSVKGAKVSDGSTWYQVQAMQGNKVVTLWINAKTAGVKVTDQGTSNNISFSPGSVTVDPGKSKTVSISFQGNGIHTLNWASSDSDICTADWGDTDWNKGRSSLTVTGNHPGTATITVSFLDENGKKFYSKSFGVTVNNYGTVLSVNSPAVKLDLVGKPSEIVTLSWGGTYPGDGYIDTKLEGVAKATLVDNSIKNGQAQMRISAEKAGTGTVTFRMNGRSTPGVFASVMVNVTATAPTYTITYDANGGNGAPAKQVKRYDEPLVLSGQRPTRTGYRFNGWATSSNATSADYQPESMYYSNLGKTLYAVWAPASGVTYTVKHYLEDESGLHLDATDTLTGTTGEWVSPVPRTYTGYSTPTTASDIVQADGSTVIEYTYIAKKYTVTLHEDEGIDSVSGSGSYQYGDTVTVNAQVRDGYAWAQWVDNSDMSLGSLEQSYTFTMPDQNIVLTATATELPKPDCTEGHTWDVWKITKKPTCKKSGFQQRFCKVCGEAQTEIAPALEHDYSVERETSTAIYYICVNCGDNYHEEKELPPTVDSDNQPGTLPLPTTRAYTPDLFWDVKGEDWFYGNVADAYEMGLMNGTGASSFSPGNNMTLAEAVTLAARIHSLYQSGKESFTRYDGGSWYDPYVDYARENQIIDVNYDYTRPATREEFVHILARALPEEALENIAGTVSFADSRDIVYSSDVKLLSGAGVINGIRENEQTYFKPDATITRAEVAAVVARMARPGSRVGK